jgi:hypothetical protein
MPSNRLRILVCVCNSDLKSAEISDGAVINCNYELCVKVVNKSNIQSKTPSRISLTRDNINKVSIYAQHLK